MSFFGLAKNEVSAAVADKGRPRTGCVFCGGILATGIKLVTFLAGHQAMIVDPTTFARSNK